MALAYVFMAVYFLLTIGGAAFGLSHVNAFPGLIIGALPGFIGLCGLTLWTSSDEARMMETHSRIRASRIRRERMIRNMARGL